MLTSPQPSTRRDDAVPDFLFDPAPPGGRHDSSDDPADRLITVLRNLGRNLVSLIGLFFVALVAFIVCTTLFSLGVSLAVFVVGLFVLVGCLVVAGASSRVTKQLLRYAGVDLPDTHYAQLRGGFGALRRLRDPQSWRDLLHVLINLW